VSNPFCIDGRTFTAQQHSQTPVAIAWTPPALSGAGVTRPDRSLGFDAGMCSSRDPENANCLLLRYLVRRLRPPRKTTFLARLHSFLRQAAVGSPDPASSSARCACNACTPKPAYRLSSRRRRLADAELAAQLFFAPAVQSRADPARSCDGTAASLTRLTRAAATKRVNYSQKPRLRAGKSYVVIGVGRKGKKGTSVKLQISFVTFTTIARELPGISGRSRERALLHAKFLGCDR
jgi:hypothetical protein